MSTETPILDGAAAPELTEPQRLIPIQQMAQPTPMGLIQMAIQQGSAIDLDRMERLMQMQERWDKEEARKAYLSAMAEFRANAPELRKDSKVDFTSSKGRTNYNYADMEEVSMPIGKVMGPLGLSFRFEPKQVNGRVFVTTILQHALGHSEQITLDGPADESGNKNSIQAVGSTITYLERYGLLAITGMAVKGQDSDGRPPVQRSPEAEQNITEAVKAITEAPDSASLTKAFNKAYAAAADRDAKDQLMAAQKKRLGELKGGAK